MALLLTVGVPFLYAYDEPTDGIQPDGSWNTLSAGLHFSWGDRDHVCKIHSVPVATPRTDMELTLWQGERCGLEAVVYSKDFTGQIALGVKAKAALRNCATVSFVNYVLTDDFRGCGKAKPTKPWLVGDVIDDASARSYTPRTVRPVWLTLDIPHDFKPGSYSLTVQLTDGKQKALGKLRLKVNVLNRQLPKPSEQKFSLNFWMQPYAVSRYYGLKPWSQAHLDALRPYMKMLARAGQRIGFAVLFYEPWGEQSNDKFDPMIETTLRRDGTWTYDYTVFDRWVQFLDSCGIGPQINCFSMVPWDMSFRYWDEASGSYKFLKAKTSDQAYRDLWTSFLKAFGKHLKERGWFDRTVIAMDERGLKDMLNAYDVAQKALPGIKMALAGNYHKELVDKVYDYCLGWGQHFTEEELALRRSRGFISTTYVCCSEPFPNSCSNSNPADGVYQPVSCIANNFEGFLRWAWMNWTDRPLQDTRFRFFTPGDTYSVYPDGRSSLRFERFIEGIQAAEKVRLLRDEFRQKGDEASLSRLNAIVAKFKETTPESEEAIIACVHELEAFLNNPL